ncbi:pirin-like C-terminal cupin domain-containing protein [Aneurinibacillus sp. Ricciae_BoGa-3]|uniref:pirin family protein n=1 Tax=Aneurinibacillus sp. Ricciae_BoGa-3 TaxID=3022697 RepID=UPI002340C1B3|nr:pirin-like C-terminal cupin domain-containing protein [Aneurinibacillus sp. Ricciae_BoGa-3]WCK53326.1 pirin-like C-terminal cupin domain-containing protein [Aneurinibacillus sp. Ricciae_BoGa-3]
MANNNILGIQKLGFQWQAEDPFLVTMHHKDDYPPGNEKQGLNASLEGRNLGEDFALKDGFRMYHGTTVPGFPAHPHCGFETVTLVVEGFVDHFDSTGAAGRYGNGDVQWLTTGEGCQHSEMFPLIHQDRENPLELFQIWLNLASKNKFAEPEFKMLWAEDNPEIQSINSEGAKTTVKLVAGNLQGKNSLESTKSSWANDRNHHVGIYLIRMEPKANFTLPAVSATLNRNLYYYEGNEIRIDGTLIGDSHRVKLMGDQDIEITNGTKDAYMLVLEGEPINEPVAQYGPFVMNTEQEIHDAFNEYRRTQFGGWEWGSFEHVNERGAGRFARHSDGRVEKR